MESVIVSRHPATASWLKSLPGWGEATVLSGNVSAADVAGRRVVGNLPLHLAAQCGEYWAVEFSGPPPRGTEYGAEELRAAGAKLTRYFVLTAEQAVRTQLDAENDGMTSCCRLFPNL